MQAVTLDVGSTNTASIGPPLRNPATSGAMRRIYSRKFRLMKCYALSLLQRCLLLSAAASVAFSVQASMAQAQPEGLQETIKIQKNVGSTRPQATKPIQDSYILGPGDSVIVELLDVPEYSGIFTIGPEGTLYLPRLRSLLVEGLTVEELRYFLTEQFSSFVREPQVFVSPAAYRPIRVYVGGEIQRPGYYYLSGQQGVIGAEQATTAGKSGSNDRRRALLKISATATITTGPQINGGFNSDWRLPHYFRRSACTAESPLPLSEVSVTRRRP